MEYFLVSSVAIGANVNKSADFPRYAMVSALTYEMIYEQPVCYEFADIKVPTLLFIGKDDNTIVGKALLSPEQQAQHGQYSKLGPETAQKIPGKAGRNSTYHHARRDKSRTGLNDV